ncbi:MAG: hypothetical protein LBU00_07430 [Treponema sp.]|nr:hypothetical protein [Treponema sp.]
MLVDEFDGGQEIVQGRAEGAVHPGESLDDPLLGFVEERTEFNPAGNDIGGVQGEAKLSKRAQIALERR